MADPFLAIAYPIAGLPHVGGGPMPGGPSGVDPSYGQGHPVPPHIGGGPVYRPPHAGGSPADPTRPADPSYGVGLWPPHVGGGPAAPPGTPGQLPSGDGAVVMPPIHYPPTIWPPNSPAPDPTKDILVLVWVPNVGLAWIAVDKDLMPSHELPEPPAHVGGGPAPTPAPKT
jgi:hypothetical protein